MAKGVNTETKSSHAADGIMGEVKEHADSLRSGAGTFQHTEAKTVRADSSPISLDMLFPSFLPQI
eukprot:1150237-Pelagomonas_calceolata.AAC.1